MCWIEVKMTYESLDDNSFHAMQKLWTVLWETCYLLFELDIEGFHTGGCLTENRSDLQSPRMPKRPLQLESISFSVKSKETRSARSTFRMRVKPEHTFLKLTSTNPPVVSSNVTSESLDDRFRTMQSSTLSANARFNALTSFGSRGT